MFNVFSVAYVAGNNLKTKTPLKIFPSMISISIFQNRSHLNVAYYCANMNLLPLKLLN